MKPHSYLNFYLFISYIKDYFIHLLVIHVFPLKLLLLFIPFNHLLLRSHNVYHQFLYTPHILRIILFYHIGYVLPILILNFIIFLST